MGLVVKILIQAYLHPFIVFVSSEYSGESP